MSLALATYKNRIASLLESSDKFIIIQSPLYNIDESKSVAIKKNTFNELLQILKNNNVTVLICGAINGCMRQLLEAQNIQVIPWITGDIEGVVDAYHSNSLFSSSFTMPGCRRKGRFRHGKLSGKGKGFNQ